MKNSEPIDMLSFMKNAQKLSHRECKKATYFAWLSGMSLMYAVWMFATWYTQTPPGSPLWRCFVPFSVSVILLFIAQRKI